MSATTKRSRVARLMLKAVRGLPEKEQQLVLEYLFETGLGAPGWVATAGAGPLPSEGKERVEGKETERRVGEALPLEGGAESWRLLLKDPVFFGGPGPDSQMIPVRLSEAQHRLLKDWCAQHGFPMAVVVRGLVERFLEDQARRAV